MFLYALAFFIALNIFSRFLIWVAPKINLLDIPGSEIHKKHKEKTPLVGGIIVIIAFSFGILTHSNEVEFLNLYFFCGAIIIFFSGLWDDFKKLRAREKLLTQLIVSILLIIGGYQVEISSIQEINWLISIIWFVGIINAFNFVDSSDGLVAGISIIITSILVIGSYFISNQPDLLVASIIFLVIILSLYSFNKFPAKLFLGDSGAQLIGFILAVLGLYFAPKGYYQISSWIAPILMFLFPIFDVTLVVFSRARRGKPVFLAGLDHTYHRLIEITHSKRMSRIIIFLIVLVSNILAIITLVVVPAIGLSIGLFVLVLFIYAIIMLESYYFSLKSDFK